jgi:hypothetical protein
MVLTGLILWHHVCQLGGTGQIDHIPSEALRLVFEISMKLVSAVWTDIGFEQLVISGMLAILHGMCR